MTMINPWLPSQTTPVICTYRRAHDSVGEKLFINEYLMPTLTKLAPENSISVDGYGNILVELGNPTLLFVAHIDTVHVSTEPAKQSVIVGDGVLSLDPDQVPNPGCLGADDASGISVLLYLISKGVKANYLFTRCEELGGQGAAYFRTNSETVLKEVKIAIEIDRRGYTDAIYAQCYGDCASIAFTKDLIKQLDMPMEPSDLGSYTDIATFADVIPECVNLPAGYFGAHTATEYVNLEYLDKLAQRLENVYWPSLEITREAGDFGITFLPDYAYNYGNSYPRYGSRELSFEEIVDLVENNPMIAAELLAGLGPTQDDLLDAQSICYGDYDYDDTRAFWASNCGN